MRGLGGSGALPGRRSLPATEMEVEFVVVPTSERVSMLDVFSAARGDRDVLPAVKPSARTRSDSAGIVPGGDGRPT